MDIVYLGIPYSHKNPAVREARARAVTRAANKLMAQGICVFSPITHNHQIILAGELPTGWDFWREHDSSFLRLSKKLIVLQLEGWKESTGLAGEIALATELGIPIEYLPADFAGPDIQWTAIAEKRPSKEGTYHVKCSHKDGEWQTRALYEEGEWYFSIEDCCKISFSEITHYAPTNP